MRRHRVVVLVLDGAQPLDVGIPAQTFQARDELPYDVLMCGVEPGIVRSGEGLNYAVEHGIEARAELFALGHAERNAGFADLLLPVVARPEIRGIAPDRELSRLQYLLQLVDVGRVLAKV